MHIISIKIKDLANLDYWESPVGGGVSILTGRNGSGKTSVLNALRWIFNGGAMVSLLRDGVDEGWAEFTLSNGHRCVKRMWRKDGAAGYELKVYSPEGADLPAAKTLIDSWLPAQAFDADNFLAMKSKDRVAWLLEHVKIEFTGEEINAALNPPLEVPRVVAITDRAKQFLAAEENKALGAVTSALPKGKVVLLPEFDAMLKLKLSQRTEVNRRFKELEGTVKTLGRGLENVDDRDWRSKSRRVEAKSREIAGQISALKSRLALDNEKAISAERDRVRLRLQALREGTSSYCGGVRNFLARIEGFVTSDGSDANTLESDTRAMAENIGHFIAAVREIAKLKTALVAFEQESAATLSAGLANQTAELETEKQALSVDLAIAQTRAEAQQRQQGVRNTITEQEEYLRALEYGEDDLTRAIRALEQLKALKLRAIDIQGFDISFNKNEPRIFINGLDFEKMNFQRQLFLAFRFLRQAKPELSFILCESANAIDSNNLEVLNGAAEAAGVQFFLEKCLAGQPLRVLPAGKFIEAEHAADEVLAAELEGL